MAIVRVLVRNLESDAVVLMDFSNEEAVDIRMLKAGGFVPAESWEQAMARNESIIERDNAPRGYPSASPHLRGI